MILHHRSSPSIKATLSRTYTIVSLIRWIKARPPLHNIHHSIGVRLNMPLLPTTRSRSSSRKVLPLAMVPKLIKILKVWRRIISLFNRSISRSEDWRRFSSRLLRNTSKKVILPMVWSSVRRLRHRLLVCTMIAIEKKITVPLEFRKLNQMI